jgi:hypothetical protein
LLGVTLPHAYEYAQAELHAADAATLDHDLRVVHALDDCSHCRRRLASRAREFKRRYA